MNYKDLRLFLLKRFELPKDRQVRQIIRSFTMAEKAVFYFFSILFIISGVTTAWKVSDAYLVEIPVTGGTLTEGMVGNPRFINPVLALSEADKNLTTLIYSGLVRVSPEGSVVYDLADEITISDDLLTYSVTINDEATFHDGTKLTADDVVFTIGKVVDPAIKSTKRGNWDGVIVEKIDEKTVSFTMKQAYASFIHNLTIGILPKHIWKNVSNDEFPFSQFNTVPVGSGPYKIDKVEINSGGIPDYYRLVPWERYIGGAPFLKNLIFKFYPSEASLLEAYKSNAIESLGGISPEKAFELNAKDSEIISSPLPRVFAVFFNQGQSEILANRNVRKALDLSAPREGIVESVLNGYGMAIEGPLPAGVYPWASSTSTEEGLSFEERLGEARSILAEDGWQMDETTGLLSKKTSSGTSTISFSISTGDAPELQAVADKLVEAWRMLGADVEIKVSEVGDLNQNVIRPRNFDALLFGQVINRDADLYPFWHSSQKTDPGLNIALYANTKADKFLEDARSAKDSETVEESYRSFAEEIKNDIPAVFLYSPSYLYVVPKRVKEVTLESLAVSQDRFLGIRNWYVETDKVWEAFAD